MELLAILGLALGGYNLVTDLEDKRLAEESATKQEEMYQHSNYSTQEFNGGKYRNAIMRDAVVLSPEQEKLSDSTIVWVFE